MWRAVDSQGYYVKSIRQENVDRETLEILGGVFATDRAHVYWLKHIIDGADPATFVVKADRMQSLARDAAQCFIAPHLVTCDELTPKKANTAGVKRVPHWSSLALYGLRSS